ncbi:MAG: YdeI/OmpD-associated family protein, partial [Parafilimonas sp.]
MIKQQSLPTKKFASAKAWQTWLAKNYSKPNGVWMMFAKKNAEKPTVTYAEALDIALCYGWIDGQKNIYDEQYWLQKFVPRQAKSIWSKKNIEHTERLIKEDKMQQAGLKAIEAAKTNGTWQTAYDAQSNMTIPEDFLKALRKNKKATAFYKTLNRTNLFSI